MNSTHVPAAHSSSSRMPGDVLPAFSQAPRVLLVDPNHATLAALQRVLDPIAMVTACQSFPEARLILCGQVPDLLVTNLRLDTFNGLHLVLLVRTSELPTRSVVYNDQSVSDYPLAREGQDMGAFYESGARLMRALPTYVRGALPQRDRRDILVFDRRVSPRGGRRAADVSSGRVNWRRLSRF